MKNSIETKKRKDDNGIGAPDPKRIKTSPSDGEGAKSTSYPSSRSAS